MFSPISQEKIQTLFREVEKPGRYIGGEVNAVRKDPTAVRLKVALIFPDVYEMGESHMGLKILYQILNAQPDILAERVYAPWTDMEAALVRHQVPLFSLENKIPLNEFDVIGITLPYELVYTNIVTILERGGVPLWQKDRGPSDPIVLGGGTCAFNPEPVAEFFDAVVVGDGEDLLLPLMREILAHRESAKSREALLQSFTKYDGVYVPSFFQFHYHQDGTVKQIEPLLSEYPGVKKATVTDLDGAPYPTSPVVPNIEVIHDRIGVEVQRGCVRACRFCQAGYIYRPERQRSPDTVKRIVAESLANTGHDEVSLLSLSVGDYEPLSPLLNELFDCHEKDKVSISLPATRTETLTPEIISQIKRVRRTGFTIAPEAGTPRMRRLINKGNAREDLMRTVENVFKEGWRLIKFYYMCGLPMELDSDLQGIVDEANEAWEIGRKYGRHPEINVSVSSFVPKPFTPFQWEPQDSMAVVKEKHDFIRSQFGRKAIRFKPHGLEMSYLEGAFSRGDRRLARVIVRAHELGCRFDEWDEQLDFAKWLQAFREAGLDPDFYVTRRRSREEILPWDHLFIEMKKDFLWEELEAAHDLAFIPDCSFGKCSDCGVCDFRKVKNVNYQYEAESGKVTAYSTRRRLLKDEPPQHLNKTSLRSPAAAVSPGAFKIRAQFSKLGDAAFLSHLDLTHLLRRALKRAVIPVGFSQGFHPMLLLSLGPALPVGVESTAEYLDVDLSEELAPEAFTERMNAVLPAGIVVLRSWTVDRKGPSLNKALREQVYRIDVFGSEEEAKGFPDLVSRVRFLKDSDQVQVERRRPKQTKTINIRPFIKDIEVVAPNRLHLVTRFEQEAGSIRPAEVLQALCPENPGWWTASRIRKVEARFEPANLAF
jgi:radical SAM family uncharacterized protein/radical SAM-linked protein